MGLDLAQFISPLIIFIETFANPFANIWPEFPLSILAAGTPLNGNPPEFIQV